MGKKTPKTFIKKIVLAGLIAGVLDIVAAFTDAWVSFDIAPGKVLIGIAAGAIRKGNADESIFLMAFGLFIHFFIVYSYTFFLYLIYPFLKSVFKNNIIIGVLYGFFIWVTMRFIVLPVFSQVEFAPFRIAKAFKPMLILIGAIGIPLSIMIGRITNSRQPAGSIFIDIENHVI